MCHFIPHTRWRLTLSRENKIPVEDHVETGDHDVGTGDSFDAPSASKRKNSVQKGDFVSKRKKANSAQRTRDEPELTRSINVSRVYFNGGKCAD